ncbi:MAG: TonB-dependent receptor [Campylobacterota bacterium]|nr:TonB-dependent receptor [Campylobacterota bacterium]
MTKIQKGIYLSFACALSLQAAQVELGTIEVEAKVDTEVIKDVHGDDIKSADLAEALFKQSPSIALSRRSGISNDILVRGQKKDNINVTIDGAKVCGACPNRMDPPISHVLTNNIDYVEINEGPYNVEDFGVLSADVKVHTLNPTDEFKGDINLGFGSWGAKKAALSASGAITENVRFLLSASTETSGQYEDGDGNDFAGQIQREIDAGNISPAKNPQYQDKYKDMDAYEKKTILAKLFWNITDNQELRLSYTGNRSDNVLYPSSKMDAIYDDSDIFNAEYIAKNLGRYSKELNIQLYQSTVEHPMSTEYREMGAVNYMTHALDTKMQGAKITNSFDVDNHTITVGVDYSLRNWDGGYLKNDVPLPEKFYHSIWDVDTENIAFFLKDKITMDKLVLDLGLRYDDTTITSANPNQQDNDYSELNGYIFATYNMDSSTKFFAGAGKSSRVPDGKELYWIGSPMPMPDGTMMAKTIGTPDLDATINYEFDIGYEKKFENATIKMKAFYSKLENFIAYNSNNMQNRYENVDATVYGFELSGTFMATAELYFDYGMAYQRGEKDDPLAGQTGTDMSEIPPFKFNAAANYDFDETLSVRAELIASGAWTNFDAENGEQELDSYGILNLKGSKTWGGFELTVGVDNVFDTTYAVSNTYNDLILLPTTPDANVMLMNEPGRYIYTNLKYSF